MRGIIRAVVTALVVTIAVISSARSADAHASLLSTSPRDRAVLEVAPPEVTLTFSEDVSVGKDAIRVLDDHGRSIDLERPRHADGDRATVVQPLPELSDGSYIVQWRVTSADSHPVRGAFTFRVGSSSEDFHVDESLLTTSGGSSAVSSVYGVVRFTAFVALAVLVGGIAFVGLLWPAGADDRRTRRLLGTAWVVAILATVAAVLVQGPYARGSGLGDAIHPTVTSEVLRTTLGKAAAVRLLLLVALGLVAAFAARGRPADRRVKAAAGALLLGVLATVSVSGHANTGSRWAALPVDVVHLGAVFLWLGGLVVVMTTLLRSANESDALTVMPSFSRVAFGCVVVAVLTGSVQSWRELGSIDALTSTRFGHLLLLKLAAVVVIIGIAAVSRVGLRRLVDARARRMEPRQPLRGLRRSVLGECVVALGILAITASLVATAPGTSASAASAFTVPYNGELPYPGGLVMVEIDPAHRGLNDIHIYVVDDERDLRDVFQLDATVRPPAEDAAPLRLELVKTGTGHYSAFGADLSLAGRWTLDVQVLLTEIDLEHVQTTIPIA